MMTWSNLLLQDSNNPATEQLILFHNQTLVITMVITIFLIYLIMSSTYNKLCNRNMNENQLLETIWTIIPMFILILIAFPSINLLYLMDEITKPSLTIKVMGHQWYWTYEYSDFNNNEVSSYLKPSTNLMLSEYRLLEVNSQLMLPLEVMTRMIVSSDDVLHSWAIPSLGIKIDAVPGRLNQVGLYMERPGTFYGQCSEICGINHSFMPICIMSLPASDFLTQMMMLTK
uniref:Cytochrome c oxidase subunit 2 n=1 Tax=Hackeriella veitchi TaxID=60873 RepID=L7N6H5_9HEMI|nr:cytochrome c oxidase subunit II [Hackeriella veitchi]ACV96702.1 cytochrome c oxidase subunit II [Hackeriella veitchi]